MEKLKNLINPGSKKDDEVMYGSGKSGDPVHDHPVSANPITSNKTGDDTGPTSAFSGYGNTPVPGANRADVDKPFGEGNQTSTLGATGVSGHSTGPSSTSRMPGTFDDDTATTASVKSGVIGESQGGAGLTGPGVTGSSLNKPLPREPETAGTGHLGHSGVGPHDSKLANKADPRVDSDLDGSKGLGSSTSGTGPGLTGTSLPDRTVGSSGYGDKSTASSSHPGRDAALGAGAGALGAGAASHHRREDQEIGGDSGRSFPLGGSSATGTSTTGPGFGSTSRGIGSGTSTTEPGLGSTSGGIGSGTTPTAGSSHQGNLSRDIPLTGAYNEESWKHDHSARGHEFGGDPCGGPEAAAPGAPHFTKGPHALDTANRLDPHVSGGPTESLNSGTSTTGTGIGSSTGTGNSSTTSGTGLGSSSTGDRHLGRDAALAGGAGALGAGASESSRGGSSSTTAGPHSSNLLNKADPRVDSDLSGQRGTSNIGQGSDFTGSTSTTAGPHSSNLANKADPSVDSDLSRQRDSSTIGQGSGLTGSTSTSAGPHSSNLVNKADPRVDSDLSGQRGSKTVGAASGVVGSPADGTSLPSDIPSSSQTTGSGHHLGRDAGLGGAGVAGVAAHEAGKHHGTSGTTPSTGTSDPYATSEVDPRINFSPRSAASGLGGTTDPASTSKSGITDPASTGKDHHYARDAGLAGAGGLAAYEGEKHLGGNKHESSLPTQSSSNASPATGALYDSGSGPTTGTSQTGTGHHLGRDAGLAGAGGATAYEAEKHLLGKNDRSTENYPTESSSSHHYGRDAAIGAGGAGLAGTAYEAEKRHAEPSTAASSGAYDTREPSQSHSARDTALAGGAGVGAGALAGEELSKKDLKHEEKELAKEQKAHQKEIAKEEKAEQKAHDKAIAKEEKAHHKEVVKAEKQHEKELAKEEKHDGEKKKHGGILGLFHRDKPDDELKKEELIRRGEYVEPDISRDGAAGSIQNPELTHSHHGAETAAGAGGVGAGAAGISEYEQHKRAGDLEGLSEADKLLQARQHDRNRLHKDPPPGYIEKKLEEQGSGSTGGRETLPDGRVIEPHTGLPMDLSKGDGSGGAGGTDSTPVPGYHQ
ncbi:MAG: hypothetical protein HETSPECPRED_001412 [Heterodermia speciosa]|uniref:Uncharacterized protein n=1 Tax=Heterodermia speciosa TaxID=116794 RepID=A0A8H3J1D0_9LECA|nr:MAG: hypothetical protein HETSPECPRED_001412 [Heterodermia speciosa]